MKKSKLLIGAPTSGTGKTTFTIGLLRALKNRQINVQAFKCGPDYIDTKYHSVAANKPSINLDIFMSSKPHVQEVFMDYSSQSDISVIEGVMGLFDGAVKMQGSSAEIAEITDTKVLLIVNAKAVAYSVAPLLYGFKNFYKNIDIVGVVFNKVSSESHYSFLLDACEDVGIESLGYIPNNSEFIIESRHLGLKIDNESSFDDFANCIANQLEKTVNIDRLIDLYSYESEEYERVDIIHDKKLSIGIAKDDAFNFTYYENIKELNKIGEISYFSPLEDNTIPDVDILYIVGGYPELYLEKLSNNTNMLDSIYNFYKNGGKIIAECGGMMYMCNNIISKEGKNYPMLGILDQDASMQNMKLHLGYRKIFISDKEYRGHEFHYSHIVNSKEEPSSAVIKSARNKELPTYIFRKNNLVASYIHFYWGINDIRNLWE
ncbi:cobyrinate a,c-diamide synthase [Marinilabiliaceae bacterium JC040]|nr:cobyrinate a,c-diamide synthase [Marinilabiliaceae bacterium JC040]